MAQKRDNRASQLLRAQRSSRDPWPCLGYRGLERFSAYKDAGDVAAAGWMLTAIQERVAERDLPYWRKLRKIVDVAVRELPRPKKTAFH